MVEVNHSDVDHGQTLAQWHFPEFEKHQRSKAWYFWVILATFALLLYAILTINFLFAVIIVIAAITFIYKHRHEPNQIVFAITEDGVELENRFHPWEIIKDFYIIYKPPEVTGLYIRFKAITKPRLSIPLQNQNPVAIKNILTQYIEEDLEQTERPFSETIGNLFKL